MQLFKIKQFKFGEQPITQFIIFESKYICSILFFYFHKSNGVQDRFHDHAFNALSVKLFGSYNEYLINDVNDSNVRIEKRKSIFKYFPKRCFHKIGNSTGCLTLLLSGPWEQTWTEKNDKNEIKIYKWHRK